MVHVSVMVPLCVGMVGVAEYSWENKEKGIDVLVNHHLMVSRPGTILSWRLIMK